jgi:multisubunit Na+/H+ antiporter MnhG subunit
MLKRANAQTFKRWVGSEGLLLALWLAALIAYFAPWIAREPVSAALAWNAYDLFDLLRFLPEIETGALTVNLQALRLPLVGLAVLLPALLANARTWLRLAGGLLGCALAMLTLPPYPQILTAWRMPGWRVPFWWAVGAVVCILLSIWLAPRLGRARQWWILIVVEIATVPAIITLWRLLPPLRRLHAAWVRPGWGFWGSMGGLGAIGALVWLRAIATPQVQRSIDATDAGISEGA